jgi:alkanesulfonate monooxygenase SsuD/methylene tetrahydromethanopterin reductase-like flavin-dependent oxidoreductase (luciferase family)
MMHFGYSLTPFGHDDPAWRTTASRDMLAFDALLSQVLQAERAGFDFVLLRDNDAKRPADALSPLATTFEPTTLVSALSTRARKIGFLIAAATSQYEPYNLARRFASLDLISRGRTGWSMIGSGDNAGDREYVDVVGGLWDSWEEDAFIYDKADSRFFRPEKMHVLDHKGEHFSVRGPLNVNRSPQGKPVLAHLFAGDADLVAAAFADVIIVDDRAILRELVGTLSAQGRQRSDIRIMLNITHWPDNPVDAAEDLQQQFETHAVAGFVLSPPTMASLSQFMVTVAPELKKRGLMRSDYSGSTLRDHLGLPIPVHPARQERAS